MYFKILKVGDWPDEFGKLKYQDMGLVNVCAAFYLEKGDDGYEQYVQQHNVKHPIIPEGGYPGVIDETGAPVDQLDYDNWLNSLPYEWHLNPFCNHSIQFEADATEEEILWCFEWALAMTHENFLKNDLFCKSIGKVVNLPFGYHARRAYYQAIRLIPEKNLNAYDKKEFAKIQSTEIKINALQAVDFKALKTIGKYSVK